MINDILGYKCSCWQSRKKEAELKKKLQEQEREVECMIANQTNTEHSRDSLAADKKAAEATAVTIDTTTDKKGGRGNATVQLEAETQITWLWTVVTTY